VFAVRGSLASVFALSVACAAAPVGAESKPGEGASSRPAAASSKAAASSAVAAARSSTTTIPLAPEGVAAAMRAPGAKLTIVNVWATWCEPCVREMPGILRVAARRAREGVGLVLISADFSSRREAVVTQLDAWGYRGPRYLKDGDDDAFVNAISRDWGGALPVTLVVDADGKARFFHEGLLEEQTLDEVLALMVE
jgi:thiol-disulfide isomerase/thioredoxin